MSPNTPSPHGVQAAAVEALLLVEIIELKWLLAGYGIRLHVERLQSDREYARGVLDQAVATRNATVRAAAERLRCGLGLNAC